MTLYEKIVKFLKQNNINYEEIHHKPVHTSEEASAIRGCKPEEGAKALIFYADKTPIQIIIEGNKQVDKKAFKKLFGFKDLQMVPKEKVLEISSVEPGAVPPFGNLFVNPLKIYCNEGLLKNEFIEFNAGNHSISLRMKSQDWFKNINPQTGSFSETKESSSNKNHKDSSILAIDHGTKKIGLAIYKNKTAAPLKILENKPNTGTELEALNEIARIIQEEYINIILLGIPLINGKENKESQKIRVFGNKLKKIVGKKIIYVDETLTTKESKIDLIDFGITKDQRNMDDSFAALIILRRFLENL